MTIRCIVVDDEPPARDEMVYLLSGIADVQLVGTAGSAEQALALIDEQKPDLVFLDIQMYGHDGFHVVEQLLDYPDPPLVIFATAFDQYAIRAFEENAVDYLLKPIEEDRLAKSLERVREALATRSESSPAAGQQPRTPRSAASATYSLASSLFANLAAPHTANDQTRLERLLEHMGKRNVLTRIAIERGGRIVLLQPDEVFFIQAQDKRLWAHTIEGVAPCHGVTNLQKLEDKLGGHDFFRVSRGELVNMRHIREFTPWMHGKYSIVMSDPGQTEITVNRSRVKDFKERLGLI
ncbi:LytR/AlgR family response regulator transcription factor [Oleidesulfovibrio sp.]|uniref:LytR/AlgR family response regulator transcription factor n=1 Tax=Oleidesulfovibrio sp. TaxID=2909707 RepID=UPI003A8C2A20